jgi:pyruvoyl-dependent arginine decarboxylase (PvlArgDC)
MSGHCKLKRNAASLGCGIPDKPTNPGLASENNKKFEAMMAERARQDSMLFGASTPPPKQDSNSKK